MKILDYEEQVFSWELLTKKTKKNPNNKKAKKTPKNQLKPKLSQLCPFKVNTKKTLVKLTEGDDLLM